MSRRTSVFYHVHLGVTGMTSWIEKNLQRDVVLNQYLCPFLEKEATFSEGQIRNMSSFGSMSVYLTDRPVDSDWPISRSKLVEEFGDRLWSFEYDKRLIAAFTTDVTEELLREAILMIDEGRYLNYSVAARAAAKSRTVFMVCPFGNTEVDHNYEFVIKPAIEKHGLKIERVDEIAHAGVITDKMLEAIRGALFVVADLTDAKPNCYYEVGYAHALAKPVIILARDGVTRHFDISTYKWTHWTDYRDLKPKLEREVAAVLADL